MQTFDFPNTKHKETTLALGSESTGNFSAFHNGKIYFSEDFGDLLDDKNYEKYTNELKSFLKEKKIKPEIILTDLHPDFKTTILGKELAKKYQAKHIQIQHHLAHIFSQILQPTTHSLKPKTYYGIALDGTGYGTDGKIWGGEVFCLQSETFNLKPVRIGHLENQIMLGGELAIRKPVRMLISILDKFLSKKEVYNFVKKYYSRNKFELLHNQLKQNFNCIETSSTGRILDAAAILLGFAKNERKSKHQATHLLEINSSAPYTDLKPKINIIKNNSILNTTFLFEYLIKNINKDKKRLAATAQIYIAEGLEEIIRNYESRIINQEKNSATKSQPIILSGGISNNKIISRYFSRQNKKAGIPIMETPAIPHGDAGLSFGQITSYLMTEVPPP
jgi:hydrogenase maturation protein HypF